ncbi:hypothetical protein [Methylovirgula sp. 4M-Z18]|uniref:hypothetical protein n=1 Tax=Methylovirgula sp. 4M-Z18 TaxID=2293567 RepID=UPI000E2EE8C7|nr:hypothetical protein [Methylovirgula sp. 4M-Z18]RFB80719.1 hypothetical protein DYH55_04275 [Methylovirgula sp. 4M-Z18]
MGAFNAQDAVKMWQDRLATVAKNLTDFAESAQMRVLRARVSDGQYTGRTLEVASQVTRCVENLWQDYLLLTRNVDEAAAKAQKSGLLRNYDEDVRQLLAGASIQLPALAVPIQQRNLLDSSEVKGFAKPEDVLTSMMGVFAQARDQASLVAKAESAGPAELQSVKADALNAELDLSEAEKLLASDPIAALDRLAKARHDLTVLAQNRAAEAQQAQQRVHMLTAADSELAALTTLVADARKDLEAARPRFAFASPDFDAIVPELDVWLAKLKDLAKAGNWSGATAGLERWHKLCAERTAQLRVARTQIVAQRDAFENLRGRFRALQVKASRIAPGQAGPELPHLQTRCTEELARVPFNAGEARRLIEAYEKVLSGRPPVPFLPTLK